MRQRNDVWPTRTSSFRRTSHFGSQVYCEGDRYTILTAPPSGFIATMHNRMPLVLKPDALDGWLSQAEGTAEELWAHCYPGTALEHHPVTRAMSSTSHVTPDCVEPVTIPQQEFGFA